jgi:hypothetical protein
MPYTCAEAVCLTFCDPISPALIPLFGPDFPSRCVPASRVQFGQMIIDSTLIRASIRQAENFRAHFMAHPMTGQTRVITPAADVSPRSHPRQETTCSLEPLSAVCASGPVQASSAASFEYTAPSTPIRPPRRTFHRLRNRRTPLSDGVCSTDTDFNQADSTIPLFEPPEPDSYSPATPPSQTQSPSHTYARPWDHDISPKSNTRVIRPFLRRPVATSSPGHRVTRSHDTKYPDVSFADHEGLAYTPRSVGDDGRVDDDASACLTSQWRTVNNKRYADDSDTSGPSHGITGGSGRRRRRVAGGYRVGTADDEAYDGEESEVGSVSSVSGGADGNGPAGAAAGAGAEKSAALLLVQLSVGDQARPPRVALPFGRVPERVCGVDAGGVEEVRLARRRRAASLPSSCLAAR